MASMNATLELQQAVKLVDLTPYFRYLEERFGIPPSTFDGYVLVQPSRKKIYIVTAEHRPPTRPCPRTVGLPFLRIYPKFPKLSTAAAQQFGHAATRNVVEADALQAEAFLTRRNFRVCSEQLTCCTGRGYVLVRYQGYTLGVGFLIPGEAGGYVESMLPKSWARDPASFSLTAS